MWPFVEPKGRSQSRRTGVSQYRCRIATRVPEGWVQRVYPAPLAPWALCHVLTCWSGERIPPAQQISLYRCWLCLLAPSHLPTPFSFSFFPRVRTAKPSEADEEKGERHTQGTPRSLCPTLRGPVLLALFSAIQINVHPSRTSRGALAGDGWALPHRGSDSHLWFPADGLPGSLPRKDSSRLSSSPNPDDFGPFNKCFIFNAFHPHYSSVSRMTDTTLLRQCPDQAIVIK